MQALQFTPATKTLALVEKPVPKIANPHHILVKVAYSGICGTDLHILQGEFPCSSQPIVLGHESSGIVVEVGANVTNVQKGDQVVIDPNNGCHRCHHCHSAQPHFCKEGGINNTIGIHRHGGWAEYVIVPDEQIHLLPPTLTLSQGALAEPLSCLAHGWDRVQPLTVGQRVLVLGAGIIGNLWMIALHLQGHRDVTVSEPNAIRRRLVAALETGFDVISPETLKQRQTDNAQYLFDLVVDCSGFAPAIEHAFTMLNYGGKLCIFGVAPPEATISIRPYEAYVKEATLVTVNINPNTFVKSIGLMQSLGDRYLDYARLGVGTFALKDYQSAIEQLKKGTIAKAIFEL